MFDTLQMSCVDKKSVESNLTKAGRIFDIRETFRIRLSATSHIWTQFYVVVQRGRSLAIGLLSNAVLAFLAWQSGEWLSKVYQTHTHT